MGFDIVGCKRIKCNLNNKTTRTKHFDVFTVLRLLVVLQEGREPNNYKVI